MYAIIIVIKTTTEYSIKILMWSASNYNYFISGVRDHPVLHAFTHSERTACHTIASHV